MSDRIGRAVRLALQPLHIAGRARSLRRISIRVVDTLVVLSLLTPTLPATAAGSAIGTTARTEVPVSAATVLESPEYQPPAFPRPEPRRSLSRALTFQDPESTPTLTETPTFSPTESETPTPSDTPSPSEIPTLAETITPTSSSTPTPPFVPGPIPDRANDATSGLMFVENVGQFDSNARFRMTSAEGSLYLAADELWLTLLQYATPPETDEPGESSITTAGAAPGAVPEKGVHLRMRFVGARTETVIKGFAPQNATFSYYSGSDPDGWYPGVPVWGGVRYEDLFPGLDVVITGSEGQWAWSVNVKDASLFALPAEEPARDGVRLRLEGALGLDIKGDQVAINTDVGTVVLPVPQLQATSGEEISTWFRAPYVDGNDLVFLAPLDAGVPTQTPTETATLTPEEPIPPTPNPTPLSPDTITQAPVSALPNGADWPPALWSNQDPETRGGGQLLLAQGIRHGGVLASPWRDPHPAGAADLIFSTYIGGFSSDQATGIAVDPTGSPAIAGLNWDYLYPTTPGSFQPDFGGGTTDCFVSRFAATGSTLVYSAYLGGDGYEECNGIAMDSTGNAYVVGWSSSTNFPTTPGVIRPTFNGSADAIITVINPLGTDFVYSTYLGGTAQWDFGKAIAVDSTGAAYVTGTTRTVDFPVSPNAPQPTNRGGNDVFVAKLAPDGSTLAYATYLGGYANDDGRGIAVDPGGAAYVTGLTPALDFPVVNPYQSQRAGGSDAFVTKLSPDGGQFLYSTYLGSDHVNTSEGANAIAVNAAGEAAITGYTPSDSFPVTSGCVQPERGGAATFVTKFAPNGSTLVFSTYWGGVGGTHGRGLAYGPDGSVLVVGNASEGLYTTSDAYDTSYNGGGDIFASRFNPGGTSAIYSTYIGGSGEDNPRDIALDPSAASYIGGFTNSSNFPTKNAYQSSLKLQEDAFVLKITMGEYALSIPTSAVLSGALPKIGSADARSGLSTFCCAQGGAGDPINTHTGGFDYSVSDLELNTSAGVLVLQRSYSSLATAMYSADIGYGWTHNHDIRLVFPGDPGGVPGKVVIKATSANQYEFTDDGDGTYSSPAGLLASLTKTIGPPVTYTVIDTSQGRYEFDESGVLTEWSDPVGHEWTYSYDGNGRVDRVTDDSGARYLDYDYDPQGRVSAVADHTGRDVSFGYDAAGDLTSFVDALDGTWTYVYDAQHHLRIVRDPDNRQVVRTEYDAQGRAYQQYDGDDTLVLEVTYNADGTSTFVDAVDVQTTHGYDPRNTLTGTTNDSGDSLSRTYDDNFRPDSITNENEVPTQLTWSSDGANLTQVIDGEAAQVDLAYNSLNSLTQLTDGRRNATIYTYNEADPDPTRRTLLLSVDGPLPGSSDTTTYTYTTEGDAPQPPGLLKTITDPNGKITHFVYDQFGQRIETNDPLGHSQQATHDSLGRTESVEDALGHSTWACYDALGRVVRTVVNATGDGGSPQTDPCDSANYQPSSDPDKDRITTSVYDDHGNLIANFEPSGAVMRTYYDVNNRPVTMIQNLYPRDSYLSESPPPFEPGHPDRNVGSSTTYDDAGNVIATADNAGIVTRTYYDNLARVQYVVSNFVGSLVEPDPPGGCAPSSADENLCTEYVYDDAGNQIAVIDPLGKVTRTYHDDNNRPVTVVENLTGDIASPPPSRGSVPDENLRTDTTYDENGNTIATQDPLGVITRTYFDEANRSQYVVVNLVGQPINTDAPPNGCAPTASDENICTAYVHDDAGRQIAVIAPDGVITRTYYDDAGRTRYTVVNLVGQSVTIDTPPNGCQETAPDENVCTEYHYDIADRQIAVIDPNGIITRTYYDGLGRTRFVVRNLSGQPIDTDTPPNNCDATGPDENVCTEYTYDSSGDQVAVTDANGIITRTYLDELHRTSVIVQNLSGQPISNDDPPDFIPLSPDENVRTNSVYDARGQVVRMIDTLDRATVSCFDDQGRVVKTIQNPTVGDPCSTYTPSGQPDEDITSITSYDAAGNRLSETDPNQKQTMYAYDGVYRLESETDPLLHVTAYGYDLNGNKVSLTDAELVATHYEYDALARLTAVVENYRPGFDPDHETNVRTEYAYDSVGSRLSILDGNGHPTTLTYDDLGRLRTESDALSHMTTYTYDAAGNKVSLLDANESTTGFGYDDLGRLTSIDYPAPDADVTYAYDPAGIRLGMTDGLGSTAWVMDDLNRPASITDPFGATVSYGYDGLGGRTSLTYPGGTRVVNYQYDDAGRLQLVTDWDSLVTSYVYDKAGRLASTTLPNTLVSSYTYDDASRLTSLTHMRSGTTLASFSHTYDNVGNRLTAGESLTQPGTVSNLLWVADSSNNRNLLFDVASVTDGENAVDLLGEYEASGDTLYTKNGVNDGPNVRGFNVPNETAIDTSNHRLFVSDTTNNRVLVFNLDGSNQLVDREADNVLGQPNLTSSAVSLTASGMNAPRGLAFYVPTNRLFVVDTGYNRVLVFDVAAISNGEAAINVLGQTTFTAGSSGLAQNRLNGPQGVMLGGDLLYVGDSTNNRVMVFDVASITNGENAVNLLGQYDATGSPLYTKNGANDGPNVRGFNAPYDSVIDPTNHRLFISDTTNNRVLVFNLDASNQLVDHVADNVLGQPNLTSSAGSLTSSGMSAPRGLAFQASTNRLFVVNTGYHRVLVFDVASITNGEAAVNVLGQATFTAGSSGLAQNRLSSPRGAALNGSLLFVGDTSNNRVMVFDVASITNGENAVNVLGQATFTTSTAATSQTGLSSPRGVVVDGSSRLFVADTTNNRIMGFDVASITNGEAAINVLGQATFTTSTAATTSTGLRAPEEVIAEASARLFVGDTSNHRIMVFDVASIANGEAAVNVLGQTTFTVGTAATAQGRLSSPAGVFLQGSLLYAADGGNHRLMVFDVTTITDGEDAVNLAGQVDGGLSPVYTKAGVHDGPNAQGFALSGTLSDLALDPTGHRLFVSDPVNNRVLVFNLDASNLLLDRIPDAVLGQTSFYSSTAAVTQSQFSSPRGLAFDPAGNRLFVADYTNNRVMVFDVAAITNGEIAVNVLGQSTFTTSTAATTQAGLRNPTGAAFEPATNLLYVADANNHRVMAFDVAAITNGENAVNAAGQVDGSFAPAYTKSGLHDGPNVMGLNLSGAFASQAIDAVGHRLFASDPTNHRVLVFNLTTDNLLIDHTPDAVLGQADFTSRTAVAAQNRFNSPRGLAYDPVGNRLFVVDYSNSRVMVFDVASISNGENAINVLGQATFTGSSGATAQNRLRNPVGASFDAGRGWLFVGDYANHRVMAFDVNAITNGENAVSVLGQATFTTNTSATTQTGLKNPSGLTIEQATGSLFVADTNNHRVMVFDATSITNGEPAVNVLGQATFTTATSATTQSGMKNPQGVEVDASASRLFVADTNNHRVTIFDVASITNGENAVHVLGQLTFTGGSSATSQGRMYAPMGVLVAPSSSATATVIAYDYDPLYRLTAADYNGGTSYFHYSYDAVGNRQTEVTQAGTTTYDYDDANRLTYVNSVPYSWDNNGNLLSDGVSTYTYDHANRLATVVQAGTTYTYGYSALGDRLRQTVNGTPTSYTLDLATSLTQVLADGSNYYLYGATRVGEMQAAGWVYHVGDALGSVRQLVDSGGSVSLARSYAPFGSTLASAGPGATIFAFTGEVVDQTGLVYLRARYMAPSTGRFLSRDGLAGDPNLPLSFNAWLYVLANPPNRVDPKGQREEPGGCEEFGGLNRLECDLQDYWTTRAHRWDRPPARLAWVGPASLPPIGDLDEQGWTRRPGAQFHVPGHTQYWAMPNGATRDSKGNPVTWQTPGARSWWGELCGQVSLAAILGEPSEAVVDAFQQLHPSWKPYETTWRHQLVALVNDTYGAHWTAWGYDWDQSLPSLRAVVSAGTYLMPLVMITNGNSVSEGGNVGASGQDIPHWVVLTGLSRDWSPDRYSILNWARIYNPFTNSNEYYPWKAFDPAWEENQYAAIAIKRLPTSLGKPEP